MPEIKSDLENINIVCDGLSHQMLLNLTKPAYKHNNVWKQTDHYKLIRVKNIFF